MFSFIGNSLGGVAVNQTLGAHVGKAEMFLVWEEQFLFCQLHIINKCVYMCICLLDSRYVV